MKGWLGRVLCVVAALLVAFAVGGCSRAKPKSAREASRGSRERASQWRESSSREVRTSDAAVAARKQREAAEAGGSAPPPDVFDQSQGGSDTSDAGEPDDMESEDEYESDDDEPLE